MTKYLKRHLFLLVQFLSFIAGILLRRSDKPNEGCETVSIDGYSLCSGYYDRYNVANDELVFNAVKADANWVTHPVRAHISCYNLISRRQRFIASTSCFNWQLGSNISVGAGLLSFNDLDANNTIVTRILDHASLSQKDALPFGTWKVDFQRGLAFTIDYAALFRERPGYGYRGKVNDDFANMVGVWDISQKAFIYQLSLQSLGFNPNAGFYFNHIIINPHRDEIITLVCREGTERALRPFRIDFKSGEISEIYYESLFSHASYVDAENIIYFGSSDSARGYVRHNLESDQKQLLYETRFDGHPTLIDHFLITDTYLDRYSRQSVYQVNVKTQSTSNIFSSIVRPRYRGHIRCDLHPKVSPDQQTVVHDFAQFSERCINILDISCG